MFALRRYHHPCQRPVGQTIAWPPVLAQAAEPLTGTDNRFAVAVQFEALGHMKPLAGIVVLLSFATTAWCAQPEANNAKLDHAVWTAIVSSLCRNDFSVSFVAAISSDKVRIAESTKSADAWQDLKRRNDDRAVTPPKELGCPGLRIASASSIHRLFGDTAQDSFALFQKRYPGAHSLLSLSIPGYSPSGTTAIVEVSSWCGILCGSGRFYHLVFKGEHWTVTEAEFAWVS